MNNKTIRYFPFGSFARSVGGNEMAIEDKKYNIIYADPPWPYDNEVGNDPAKGGMPYKSMELEEIYSLPVQELVDKDCVLFLWATMPKLKEGITTIERWGFKYITCAFVWVKKRGSKVYSGLGHWVNGNAELCLLGKVGHPKRLNKNVKQILMAQLREHSRKPDEARERIVQLMGELPRIELFARQRMEGWDVWGDEAPPQVQMTLKYGQVASLPYLR